MAGRPGRSAGGREGDYDTGLTQVDILGWILVMNKKTKDLSTGETRGSLHVAAGAAHCSLSI